MFKNKKQKKTLIIETMQIDRPDVTITFTANELLAVFVACDEKLREHIAEHAIPKDLLIVKDKIEMYLEEIGL